MVDEGNGVISIPLLKRKDEIKTLYKSVKSQLFPKIVHVCSVQMWRMQAYQNFEIYKLTVYTDCAVSHRTTTSTGSVLRFPESSTASLSLAFHFPSYQTMFFFSFFLFNFAGMLNNPAVTCNVLALGWLHLTKDIRMTKSANYSSIKQYLKPFCNE